MNPMIHRAICTATSLPSFCNRPGSNYAPWLQPYVLGLLKFLLSDLTTPPSYLFHSMTWGIFIWTILECFSLSFFQSLEYKTFYTVHYMGYLTTGFSICPCCGKWDISRKANCPGPWAQNQAFQQAERTHSSSPSPKLSAGVPGHEPGQPSTPSMSCPAARRWSGALISLH